MMTTLRAAALAALLTLPAAAQDAKDRLMPTRVAFSPDAKALAVVGYVEKKPAVEVWDVAARRRRWRVSIDATTSTGVAWPGDKTLLVVSGPAVLEIDPATGKTVRTLEKHSGKVVAMALSADGKALATAADDRTVLVRDWKADRVRAKAEGDAGEVLQLALSRDGSRVAAANGKAVVTWSTADGKRQGELKSGHFHKAAVQFRGAELITGSYDGVIRVFSGDTVLMRFRGPGGVHGLAVHEGRHLMAAQGVSNSLALYDVNPGPPDAATAGRIKGLLKKLDGDSYETREAASRDLKSLGFIAEKALREAVERSPSAEVRIRARVLHQGLFDAGRSLVGHTARARDVAFTADGKVLASCADDGTVRLWDTTTAKETAKLP